MAAEAAAHQAEEGSAQKKEMDAKMMDEMMKDHARKIREVQGKVSSTQDARKKALQERLAKKKAKANQVAPNTSFE